MALVSSPEVACGFRYDPNHCAKPSKTIPSQQKELESRIIRWIFEKARKGFSTTQIKKQALKFANEMQIENLGLKFSDGWMRHFKKGKDCDTSYFF